jgi:hypothetical protein
MGIFDFSKKASSQSGNGEITKSFLLKRRSITITVPIDQFDSTKILSNKFAFANMHGKKIEMVSREAPDTFFSQLRIQLNYLETREIPPDSLGVFFDALIVGCTKHIEQHKRIIITDLFSQVNYTMWLVEATRGIFHNILTTEDEYCHYRDFLIKTSVTCLKAYLWVPDPNGELDQNGKLKIVKASTLE